MNKLGKHKLTIKLVAKEPNIEAAAFLAMRDPVLLWFREQALCGQYITYLDRSSESGKFYQTFAFDDIRDVMLFKVTWDKTIEGATFEGW